LFRPAQRLRKLWALLPVDQRLKLLGNPDVQLDDTLVTLTLSIARASEFLGSV
jgi:hypothetical protein